MAPGLAALKGSSTQQGYGTQLGQRVEEKNTAALCLQTAELRSSPLRTMAPVTKGPWQMCPDQERV